MDVELRTAVGPTVLPNPVMTASGTAGHGAELHAFFDLALLGAHVVKSLAAFEWAGNAAPRLHPAGTGMLNAVGLQGPGVESWTRDELPVLAKTNARVVVSIWGRTVDDYRRATELLTGAHGVVAVEVNLSCPNLEGRRGIFAHDPQLSADVISSVVAATDRPVWAKLSANTDRVVEVAAAVQRSGAAAVTLINTLLGLVFDADTLRPALAAGGGGYSGRPIHAVAVRTVFDVHAAIPDLPIVGTGGVASSWDAVELLLAGASAVQVGTATFADPRAPLQVLRGLERWCRDRGVTAVTDLVGAGH